MRYWRLQVMAKQRNIVFAAVREDFLLDVERRGAMVKWEASFDVVAKSGAVERSVRFVQVAALRFDAEGLITLLEEYWSSVTDDRWRTPFGFREAEYLRCLSLSGQSCT